MTGHDELKSLRDKITEGQRIMALTDFYEAERQYGRWVDAVNAEIGSLELDSHTRLQWVNLANRRMAAARDKGDLQGLRSTVLERMNWLGERISAMGALAGTPHQLHKAGEKAPTHAAPVPAPVVGGVAANRRVFVVHGHDHGLKNTVARYLELLGLVAVVLHEQPDGGQTVIEKFEAAAETGFAVVVATADDLGESQKRLKAARPAARDDVLQARARQNVVFELGYFVGKLGRGRTFLIADQNLEIPSDLGGVIYSGRGEWTTKLWRDLRSAGYGFDAEQISRATAVV